MPIPGFSPGQLPDLGLYISRTHRSGSELSEPERNSLWVIFAYSALAWTIRAGGRPALSALPQEKTS
jgi:hypothetical protein